VRLLEAHALELLGKTAEAYSFLVSSYAAQPTDEFRSQIDQLAGKIGKSPTREAGDIWAAISGNATPAIPFALPGFTDAKPVTLESYRGHVVIVDFWFPLCGPCRQAFPYLQQVLSKYKDRGVVVLAINVAKEQETEVIPYLKSKGYGFIPLKGTNEWALSHYHVRSYPTTFLIGSDGRVYFRPRTDDRFEERTTELEVEELLAHTG
jgi:thiol-disulfide isomerase/thioredoxin